MPFPRKKEAKKVEEREHRVILLPKLYFRQHIYNVGTQVKKVAEKNDHVKSTTTIHGRWVYRNTNFH